MFSAFYFNLIYFILSDFISYCSCYYAFCLCVVWDVYVSSSNFAFFIFLLMIYILYSHCLFILRIIFLLSLLLISSLSSSQSFYFFNTTGHWGRIQQMNSSGMVYPYPLVTLGSRRVSIIFIFIPLLLLLIFFVSYTLVTTVEVLTPSFIFIIWHHLIMIRRRQRMYAVLVDVIWAVARCLCKMC